jgi:hypothetical protein
MTKTVIFGITGETGLWVADLQSGTITPVKGQLSGELANAASLREAGVSLTKGVDIAIAVSASELPASGIHEGND